MLRVAACSIVLSCTFILSPLNHVHARSARACADPEVTSGGSHDGIVLHQRWIESQQVVPATLPGLATVAAVKVPAEPSFDDPASVLSHVLAAAPERAVVYPTEQYYYYRFPLGPRIVSGNIRLCDAELGRISVGYFDAHNPRDTRTAEFVSGQDGVRIEHDAAAHEVALEHDGLRRVFVLDQSAFVEPSFPLMEGEEHISGIRDESGYYLHLMYWKPRGTFYYVLDPDRPLPERWHAGGGARVDVWFGEESRFCFLRHAQSGRLILVGVHRREIMHNSWFDGPFDQVPPRLAIREQLESAYPYVKEVGGIDEHGNFRATRGQRVAISPYSEYESGPELVARLEAIVEDVDSPVSWAAAVYEWKRDWRPNDVSRPDGGHHRDTSSAWPANHWAMASGRWGGSHEADLSRSWPANHMVSDSRRPGR